MGATQFGTETTRSQTPYCGVGPGHPPEPVSAKAPWLQMRFMVIASDFRLRRPTASVQAQCAAAVRRSAYAAAGRGMGSVASTAGKGA